MNETDDHKEMGKGSQLRDAYLFAAPILCDPCSAMVFNTKMDAEVDLGRPKTMWRITSNNDIVATGLPERGDPIVTALTRKVTDKKIDAKSYYGPTHSCDECKNPNNFNFAHLGTEIILYDSPHPSDVAGGHVTHGAKVKIHSNFGPADIREQRGKRMASWSAVYRERVGIVLQKIPLVGRVVAHCTIYYWDQLDRAATKECDWVVS